MKSFLERVLNFGMRRGLERGVLDGDRAWLIVGALALLAHWAGRELRREPRVVFSSRLPVGESLQIFHEDRN